MKQECPAHLKSIGKSKALVATLTNIEPKIDSNDSDHEETFTAFTATIELPNVSKDLVNEDEELLKSEFEKLDENDDIQINYT